MFPFFTIFYTIFGIILLEIFAFNEIQLMNHLQNEKPEIFKKIRPVKNITNKICITYSIDFIQIVELNEKQQKLTTVIWKRMTWRNEYFTWNQSEYSNISVLHLESRNIWTPDIVLYEE